MCKPSESAATQELLLEMRDIAEIILEDCKNLMINCPMIQIVKGQSQRGIGDLRDIKSHCNKKCKEPGVTLSWLKHIR